MLPADDAIAGARERVAADGQRFLQDAKHPLRRIDDGVCG
jgi:hypothetical protein